MALYKNMVKGLIVSLVMNTFILSVSYKPYLQFHAVDVYQQDNGVSEPQLEFNPLDKNQLRIIAVKLLEESGYSYPHSYQADENFIQKIELTDLTALATQSSSVLGELSFYTMMAQPLVSANEIKKRQEIIAQLLNDEELYRNLYSALDCLQELEPYALHYFTSQNQIIEQMVDKAYFPGFLGRLNKNSFALDIKTRLQHFGFLLTVFLLPIEVFTVINNIKYGLMDDEVSFKTRLKDFFKLFGFWNYKRGEKSYKEFLNDFFANPEKNPDILPQNSVELITFINCLPQKLKMQIWESLSPKMMIGAGVSIGLVSALYGYSIYASYSQQKLLHDITMHLQKQLMSLRCYLDCVEKAYLLLQEHPELHHLESFKNLEKFFDVHQQSPRLKEVLTLLKKRTFAGQASFFSLSGRVLAAHKIVRDNYKELQPLFIAAGEIDAFFAAATFYKKHQDTAATFCFASLVEVDQPYIEAQAFWNPLIDADKVVTNDLIIGDTHAQNLIVTGPNTTGKTTLIKGLMDEVLYAQVFGIAPAAKMIFTPFHILNCYLNITDNLKEGHSLFKAEILRARELINGIASLNNNQFAFTIIDELFTGTAPEEGAHAAVKFAKKLSQFSNSICLFATHFKELTVLEQSVPVIANYHVPLIKQADGTLYRPFKIEPGINKLNIAIDLLEMEGIF